MNTRDQILTVAEDKIAGDPAILRRIFQTLKEYRSRTGTSVGSEEYIHFLNNVFKPAMTVYATETMNESK